MNREPIDVTRVTLRALRLLDDGRRALDEQWRRWTTPDKPEAGPPSDRRQPPGVW